MFKSFEEILDEEKQLAVKKYGEIKSNSKKETKIICTAREKYKHQIFLIDKEKLLNISDLLIKTKLADENKLREIKFCDKDYQLDTVFISLRPRLIDFISNIKPEYIGLNHSEQDYRKLKDENNKSTYKIEMLVLEIQKLEKRESKLIKRYESKIDSILQKNISLNKELKVFRTPERIIKDKVDFYVEQVIKNEKKPTVVSLALASKGTDHELSKSGWSNLIKTRKFMAMVRLKLIEEKEKLEKKLKSEHSKNDSIKNKAKIESINAHLLRINEVEEEISEKIRKLINLEEKIQTSKKHKEFITKKKDNYNNEYEGEMFNDPRFAEM